MSNGNLTAAKRAKNDEFYTQLADIEREMNAYHDYDPDVFRDKVVLCPCDDPEWSNFTRFFALHFAEWGLKRLISTSYAPMSNGGGEFYQPSIDETKAPQYDPNSSMHHGRVLTLDHPVAPGDPLDWKYLDGDGDFRSPEVTALRDEADVVATNPPFSQFRDFVGWLMEGDVRFSIIGNVNAITYKEIFPLIRDNRTWLGASIHSGDREFRIPKMPPESHMKSLRMDDAGNMFIRVPGVRWFTNIEHGRRHEPLQFMSMADNLRFNKRLRKKLGDVSEYPHYDNYDAIEVPFVDAIPSNYTEERMVAPEELDSLKEQGFEVEVIERGGETVRVRIMNPVMGVPITFLDKYNPTQFDILGKSDQLAATNGRFYVGGRRLYDRLAIRRRPSACVS
jgi:hypothetical protein